MSSSNDQAVDTKVVEETPVVSSETNKEESKPADTEMGSTPMKVKAAEPEKEADAPAAEASNGSTEEEPAAAAPAAAKEEEAKPAEPAAAPAEKEESSDMDTTSSDEKEKPKKRKASEIEEEAPKENGNGSAEPAEAPAAKENGEAPADKENGESDTVAAKKAKTLNGDATATKVVPGDAKAATDAMPQQAPVA